MKRTVSLALSLVAGTLCWTAPVLADDAGEASGLRIGVIGGTNGLGAEVGYRFNSRLGLRANLNSYNYDKSLDTTDFDIDGKARLKSFGALVDLYPFGGSFHLSAGMRSNKNHFGGVALPTNDAIELGDSVYTAAQVGTLTGDVKFKKTVPTATLGWAGKFKTGLHFDIELGVVAQGSAQLAATSNGTLASNPAFQTDLDAKLAEWEDDAKDYKLWPVIQLGLSYRF